MEKTEEIYCKLCGEELKNGTCPNGHVFKKMCINCESCKKNEEGLLFCTNEKNLLKIKEKMLKAANEVSEGYEVQNLEVKPLPLKKPILKCGNWVLSSDVLKYLVSLFE